MPKVQKRKLKQFRVPVEFTVSDGASVMVWAKTAKQAEKLVGDHYYFMDGCNYRLGNRDTIAADINIDVWVDHLTGPAIPVVAQ